MTNRDAVDWIKGNLPTAESDGVEVVVCEHDTDGNSECPVCGRAHIPTTETIPVESLADQYEDAILNGDPLQEAVDRGKGHDRFFAQS